MSWDGDESGLVILVPVTVDTVIGLGWQTLLYEDACWYGTRSKKDMLVPGMCGPNDHTQTGMATGRDQPRCPIFLRVPTLFYSCNRRYKSAGNVLTLPNTLGAVQPWTYYMPCS